MDGSFVPDIAAAVEARVRVDDLAPYSRLRDADAVVMARRRRHVADDENWPIAFVAKPPERVDGIRAIIADDPPESGAFGITRMQRRLGAIEPVEIAHQPLNAGMVLVLQRWPVDFGVVIPFMPLRDLAAHEEELLARMRPHEPEVGAQVRELLPVVA